MALSLRLVGGDFVRELDESESESSQELCCSVASASSFCLSSDLPSLHGGSCQLKHCKGNTVSRNTVSENTVSLNTVS